MQHSVLNFHLNIQYLSGQQREKVTKTERLSRRQKHRKAKGQKVKEGQEERKVSEKKAHKERKGHINRQRERWIQRLIVTERAMQCSIYIRLSKDI